MGKTIEALFDGRVFHPVEPVLLDPNTRVMITIEAPPEVAKGQSFLETARALNLDGPEDWSEKLEEYLTGEVTHEG